ncbi:MAG: hypothetical protein AAGF11_46420 [Myxococcota bacterium]
MPLMCPRCYLGVLEIDATLDVYMPDDDELQIQSSHCVACGRLFAGIYEESRRGSGSRVHHAVQDVSPLVAKALDKWIAQCPQPRSRQVRSCRCAAHEAVRTEGLLMVPGVYRRGALTSVDWLQEPLRPLSKMKQVVDAIRRAPRRVRPHPGLTALLAGEYPAQLQGLLEAAHEHQVPPIVLRKMFVADRILEWTWSTPTFCKDPDDRYDVWVNEGQRVEDIIVVGRPIAEAKHERDRYVVYKWDPRCSIHRVCFADCTYTQAGGGWWHRSLKE